MFENDKGLDTSAWQPAAALWLKLTRDHPQHRLGGSGRDALGRFLRHHKKSLHAAGIIVRMPATRSWLADPERFGPAVLLLVTGAKVSSEARHARKPKAARRPGRGAADRSAHP